MRSRPCLPHATLPLPADTLHANLTEVKDLFEIKRFAMFDQVGLASTLPLLLVLHRSWHDL